MTNFEKSAIILNGEILPLPINGTIKTIEIKTEEYADENDGLVCLHSECKSTCDKNKKKMDRATCVNEADQSELHFGSLPPKNDVFQSNQLASNAPVCIDGVTAAHYLITLYKSIVDEQGKYLYSCSTTKLGKLLTIAAWIHAASLNHHSEKLLLEDIVSKRCGTTISGLTLNLLNQEFTIGQENGGTIDNSYIKSRVSPSNYVEQLMCFVFCNFGAYKSGILGEYINQYKPDVDEDAVVEIGAFVERYEVSDKMYIESDIVNDTERTGLRALSHYVTTWDSIICATAKKDDE